MQSRREAGERPAWLNADNSVDLLVPVPYTEGSTPHRLDKVQLRRLTGAELLILDQPLLFTEKLMQILEAMTGLPRVVTIKIDSVDFDRIDDCFGYFKEPGSVIGATSSAS